MPAICISCLNRALEWNRDKKGSKLKNTALSDRRRIVVSSQASVAWSTIADRRATWFTLAGRERPFQAVRFIITHDAVRSSNLRMRGRDVRDQSIQGATISSGHPEMKTKRGGMRVESEGVK